MGILASNIVAFPSGGEAVDSVEVPPPENLVSLIYKSATADDLSDEEYKLVDDFIAAQLRKEAHQVYESLCSRDGELSGHTCAICALWKYRDIFLQARPGNEGYEDFHYWLDSIDEWLGGWNPLPLG